MNIQQSILSIDEAVQAVKDVQGIKEPEQREDIKGEPVYIINGSIGEPVMKPGDIIYCKPTQIRRL